MGWSSKNPSPKTLQKERNHKPFLETQRWLTKVSKRRLTVYNTYIHTMFIFILLLFCLLLMGRFEKERKSTKLTCSFFRTPLSSVGSVGTTGLMFVVNKNHVDYQIKWNDVPFMIGFVGWSFERNDSMERFPSQAGVRSQSTNTPSNLPEESN